MFFIFYGLMIIDFVWNNQRIYSNIDVMEYKDIFIILHNFIFFKYFWKKIYGEKTSLDSLFFLSFIFIYSIYILYYILNSDFLQHGIIEKHWLQLLQIIWIIEFLEQYFILLYLNNLKNILKRYIMSILKINSFLYLIIT